MTATAAQPGTQVRQWFASWFDSPYYHKLYAHRDEAEAARFVDALLQTLRPDRGADVLDLGCGAGRHARRLAAHGLHVTGMDLSASSLLEARRFERPGLHFRRHDMRRPFGKKSFDYVFNFFTSFGYFAEEEENLQVVREMARVLEPNAPFLFDYLNVDRELENLVQRETRQTPMGSVRIERWFDRSDRSFNKRMTIGEKRYLERVRGYDLDEISAMFASCNLSISTVFGDFDGKPFTRTSPRLILVGSRAG